MNDVRFWMHVGDLLTLAIVLLSSIAAWLAIREVRKSRNEKLPH